MSKKKRQQRARRQTQPTVHQQMSGPIRLGMGLGLVLAAALVLWILTQAGMG